MHGGVEACQLNAVPEGAPDEPWGVVAVDDEVGVDGIPVVTLLSGGDDAAFVFPHVVAEGTAAEQTYGRTVLAEGGTAVGKPPAVVPADDVWCPHVIAEARH